MSKLRCFYSIKTPFEFQRIKPYVYIPKKSKTRHQRIRDHLGKLTRQTSPPDLTTAKKPETYFWFDGIQAINSTFSYNDTR